MSAQVHIKSEEKKVKVHNFFWTSAYNFIPFIFLLFHFLNYIHFQRFANIFVFHFLKAEMVSEFKYVVGSRDGLVFFDFTSTHGK